MVTRRSVVRVPLQNENFAGSVCVGNVFDNCVDAVGV